MHNQEKVKELKEALFKLVSHKVDEDSKIDLKIALEKYFDEQIHELTREELSTYLDTPQKLVRHFKDFLNR